MNRGLSGDAPRPRVVVTGVAGFIGSNLAHRLLQEGYPVVGIDNLAYGLAEQIPEGVTFHQVDIRDRSLADVLVPGDVLFHLAAKNCIADCQDDPVETADINVTGTVNVFRSAVAAGAAKVVYAQSSAVYEGVQTMPTDEGTVAPETFYAVSKIATQYFADAYRRFYGLPLTGLRYFNVYGPRQDYRRSIPPVMSAFMLSLMRGQAPVIYGNGTKRRDFVYVDDINDFHLRCIDDRRTDGQTYNMGSGQNHSVIEIFERIRAVLGSDIRPRREPDLPGEAQETLADISAVRRLGWEPRTTLDEGLVHMIEYLRAHARVSPA